MLKGASLVLLVAAFGWGGWFFTTYISPPETTVRYRLNLDLEVDGAPRTYSVVQEVRMSEISPLVAQREHFARRVYGQALIIQPDGLDALVVPMMSLGGHKGSVAYSDLFFESCIPRENLPDGTTLQSYLQMLSQFEGRCEVNEAAWPLFLRFPDLSNYEEIYYVDPHDLAKTYSSRVEILSVSVETTKESISTGIRDVMPWLGNDDLPGLITAKKMNDEIFLAYDVFERRA